MPKLDYPPTEYESFMHDVISVRKTAVTVGVEGETERWELEFHEHPKSQLMLSMRGLATCEAEGGLWLVPPQSAVFIPSGVRHRVTASGKIEGYAVFLDPQTHHRLPSHCSTIKVNALLRELIVRSAEYPTKHPQGGTESRVTALMLEEIAVAPVGGLHLPMPRNPKLRKIFSVLLANPAERSTLETWARRAGLGERTLSRVVVTETGMSFGRWRQQLHILLALQWMAGGATVQQVALDLGYESAGSFVTMFRKALGMSPKRYMTQRSSSC